MATSIWKGHLSFGLVSIPVKLSRAARAEKVSFRQGHEATGSRVRQALYREPEDSMDLGREAEESETGISDTVIPFPSQPRAVEVSRGELAKEYEYEPGRYLVLSREEIESITPRTAYEMQILGLFNWPRWTHGTSRPLTMQHPIEEESERTHYCSKHCAAAAW